MERGHRGTLTRRQFTALLLASLVPRTFAGPAADEAGRRLDFKFRGGFGDASAADIEAVLRSAAESIWQHCPSTRWEVPGFFIYHNELFPITLNEHTADGRIAIGLTSKGRLWAQFAYQFAHEFCHALARHSNDWHKLDIERHGPNHWLEESLCETASLFALRAMGKSWQTAPPYPNWKDYAGSLTQYAQERIDKTAKSVPDEEAFIAWFRENEAAMRENPALREKNNVVASKLLPLFEATPDGWEAVTFYNVGKRQGQESLAAQFADWAEHAPPGQREFIGKVAAVFGNKV